jgi:hypothetical protein
MSLHPVRKAISVTGAGGIAWALLAFPAAGQQVANLAERQKLDAHLAVACPSQQHRNATALDRCRVRAATDFYNGLAAQERARGAVADQRAATADQRAAAAEQRAAAADHRVTAADHRSAVADQRAAAADARKACTDSIIEEIKNPVRRERAKTILGGKSLRDVDPCLVLGELRKG